MKKKIKAFCQRVWRASRFLIKWMLTNVTLRDGVMNVDLRQYRFAQ